MRKSFLAVLLVLILALPLSVLAKEYELGLPVSEGLGTASHFYNLPPSPLMPGETELYWDDGTSVSSYFPSSYSPYATTFTAPADCHLVRYRFYWYGGGNVDVSCLLYNDDGGGDPKTPTGSTLFTITGNSGSTSWDWFNVDVTSAGATLTNGQIFHPGWSHTSTSAGVMLDDAKGGYSCWLWLGSWYDYSAYYTHMMRVVINDDTSPPYADTFDPPDGGYALSDTTISFHVRDDDVGVDTPTIYFTAEDSPKSISQKDTVSLSKGVISGILDIDDSNPNDVVCTFTPDSDLTVWDTITCTLDAGLADTLGNATDSDIVWHFTVIIINSVQPTSLGHIKAQYN